MHAPLGPGKINAKRLTAVLLGLAIGSGVWAADADSRLGTTWRRPREAGGGKSGGSGVKGVQFGCPHHRFPGSTGRSFSHLRRAVGPGGLGRRRQHKVSARADYDFAYGINDFYPPGGAAKPAYRSGPARKLSRRQCMDWDFHHWQTCGLGRDGRDLFRRRRFCLGNLREFILPEFEAMRIPSGRPGPSTSRTTSMPNCSGFLSPATTRSASPVPSSILPAQSSGRLEPLLQEKRPGPAWTT